MGGSTTAGPGEPTHPAGMRGLEPRRGLPFGPRSRSVFPEEAEVGVELHQLKRFHDAVRPGSTLMSLRSYIRRGPGCLHLQDFC